MIGSGNATTSSTTLDEAAVLLRPANGSRIIPHLACTTINQLSGGGPVSLNRRHSGQGPRRVALSQAAGRRDSPAFPNSIARRGAMKTIVTLLVLAVLVVVGGIFYIQSGLYDVAATGGRLSAK